MRKRLRSAMAGGLAGAVATLAMSAVLLAGKGAGLYGAHPPELLIKRATARDGPLPTLQPEEQDTAWPLGHLQFGSAVGALYGCLRPNLPADLRSIAGGAMVGGGLWLVNYGALAPAFELLPPIPRDDLGRQATNAVAHLVYGATLAGLLEWWNP